MSPSDAFERLAYALERRIERLEDSYPPETAVIARIVLREQVFALRDVAKDISQSEWEERMGDDL